MSRKYVFFAAFAVFFTALDQWTKYLVQQNIPLYRGEIPLIDGFLSLVHTQNSGAAFGMLGQSEYRLVVFAVFTVVAVGVLFQMLRELPGDDRFQSIALGLIMSGAVGNAIDRVLKQSVTDFVRVYTESPSIKPTLIDWFGTAEWPSWNVADAAIVVGLGMFGISYLFLEKDEEELTPDPPKAPLKDPS